MVTFKLPTIKLTVILMVCIFLHAESGANTELKIECNKTQVYMGEPMMCDFVLYSSEPVLNIEIAKFPEFRGFWKQNIALRQGRIGLSWPDQSTLKRRASIATYFLTPMVGDRKPEIKPMKLVLKSSRGEAGLRNSRIILSAAPPTIFKPLPPVASTFVADGPVTAVGNFTLSSEKTQLPFEKKAPIVLRYQLHGSGNFQEINTLKVRFPSEIEVLSKKVSSQGSAVNQIKTFEWTLAVHSEENVILPPLELAYFHPINGNYQKTQSSPVALTFQPSPKAALDTPPPALNFRPWQSEINPLTLWRQTPFFFTSQGMLLLAIFFGLIAKWAVKWRKNLAHSPKALQRRKLDEAREAYKQGDLPTFLKIAEKLAYQKLMNDAQLDPSSYSRDAGLEQAAQNPALTDTCKTVSDLSEAHQNLVYHPAKIAPQNPDALLKDLERLVG